MMPETTQGVAQRVLSRYQWYYDDAVRNHWDHSQMRFEQKIAAVEHLHAELSAEARAVLAGYRQAQQEAHERGRFADVDLLTENEEAVREFCDRLGLSFTTEAQDGETRNG